MLDQALDEDKSSVISFSKEFGTNRKRSQMGSIVYFPKPL